MTVDVATYPIYHRALIDELHQTWGVEPAPSNGTRLTLTFQGRMKLGVIGQVVATVMGQPRRLDEILAAYEADILGMLPRPTVSVPT